MSTEPERPISPDLPPPSGVEAPDLVMPGADEHADEAEDFRPDADVPEPPD